ncbi:MAG: helix-turn-helix domain-containing protein [Clostridia bacterium]|nr:helix-turn-helix domain-containing protein [Clostridia bacterium]
MGQQPENSLTYFTNEHAEEIGKNIRRIRKKETRANVGARMRSNDSTVYNMEKGKSLTLANLIQLCQALDCTIEELLPDEFKPLASRSNKGISMMPTETLTLLSAALSAEQQRRDVA